MLFINLFLNAVGDGEMFLLPGRALYNVGAAFWNDLPF